MSATRNVPVTITDEARERVDELGMHAELSRMIDHVGQAVPQLVRIEVETIYRYGEDGPPGVCVMGMTTLSWEKTLDYSRALGMWRLNTFPREVSEQFLLSIGYEEASSEG